MYVCVCTYMCVYVYVSVCVCTLIFMHANLYLYACIYRVGQSINHMLLFTPPLLLPHPVYESDPMAMCGYVSAFMCAYNPSTHIFSRIYTHMSEILRCTYVYICVYGSHSRTPGYTRRCIDAKVSIYQLFLCTPTLREALYSHSHNRQVRTANFFIFKNVIIEKERKEKKKKTGKKKEEKKKKRVSCVVRSSVCLSQLAITISPLLFNDKASLCWGDEWTMN